MRFDVGSLVQVLFILLCAVFRAWWFQEALGKDMFPCPFYSYSLSQYSLIGVGSETRARVPAMHGESFDILKRALLDEQDLSPTVNKHMLQQTTDQDIDDSFISLEPPFDMDDYIFDPNDTGSLADLFDAYDIDCDMWPLVDWQSCLLPSVTNERKPACVRDRWPEWTGR